MITKHIVYKYETAYIGLFVMTQFFTNDTVKLQFGPTKIGYNIRQIKLYKSGTKVEDINSKNMSDGVSIWSPVIYFSINYKSWKQGIK